jgi:hypothetical protein
MHPQNVRATTPGITLSDAGALKEKRAVPPVICAAVRYSLDRGRLARIRLFWSAFYVRGRRQRLRAGLGGQVAG